MKKSSLFLVLLFLMFSGRLLAQAPQLINYQAVVRDATGNPVANQTVGLRFTIHNTSPTGTVVYQETQNLSTNGLGLVSIQIGGGSVVSGNFSAINWGASNQYLQVEADITGGTSYQSLANVQLVSVPYALNAKTSSDNKWDTTATVDIINKNTGNIGIGGNPNAAAKLDISATNKGILIPRITLSNRPATPTNGLLIYQTDNTPGFYYYNGTAWVRVANTADVGNTGTIVPFSSGGVSTLTTIAGGLAGTTSLIGFGNSASGVTVVGNTIDLTGSSGTLLNFAFVCPRSGNLSAISAQFSNTVALSLLATTVTVTAQLYTAVAGSNSFTPISGASVNLAPGLANTVAVGTTSYGTTTGLNIPMIAGNRYLMVFSATATGIVLINSVVGYASAGININ